jgi:IS30 family transposase
MGNKRGHISREERFCIEKLLAAGDSYREIAKRLGRGLSTISQEVARCGGRKGYTASSAHKVAKHRQWYKKRSCLKVALDPYLCRRVEADIRGHISPERISGRLRLEGQPYASPKAIRRFAHSRHFESYLYRKGLNRRWRGWGKARQERFAGRIFVDDPRCVRTGYGHWEGDFIVSSVSTPVLLVLVERRTKETIIRWIRNRTNERVYRVIEEALAGKHVASLAVDNDIAFAQHRDLSSRLGAPVYFARPFRSNDKPLVENTNRWIRWFVPKKTDLRDVTIDQVRHIEDWLNSVPRQCLGFYSSREVTGHYTTCSV